MRKRTEITLFQILCKSVNTDSSDLDNRRKHAKVLFLFSQVRPCHHNTIHDHLQKRNPIFLSYYMAQKNKHFCLSWVQAFFQSAAFGMTLKTQICHVLFYSGPQRSKRRCSLYFCGRCAAHSPTDYKKRQPLCVCLSFASWIIQTKRISKCLLLKLKKKKSVSPLSVRMQVSPWYPTER